jgi:hypothetical protein
MFHGWHQQPPMEGGGKLLYLSLKNEMLETSQQKLEHLVFKMEHSKFEI